MLFRELMLRGSGTLLVRCPRHQPGLAADIAQGVLVGRAERAHALLDETEPRHLPRDGMHEIGDDMNMRPAGVRVRHPNGLVLGKAHGVQG